LTQNKETTVKKTNENDLTLAKVTKDYLAQSYDEVSLRVDQIGKHPKNKKKKQKQKTKQKPKKNY
jgi:hypothetical protein